MVRETRLLMDLPCGKFGDCSFSRFADRPFWHIGRITHKRRWTPQDPSTPRASTRVNDALTRHGTTRHLQCERGFTPATVVGVSNIVECLASGWSSAAGLSWLIDWLIDGERVMMFSCSSNVVTSCVSSSRTSVECVRNTATHRPVRICQYALPYACPWPSRVRTSINSVRLKPGFHPNATQAIAFGWKLGFTPALLSHTHTLS